MKYLLVSLLLVGFGCSSTSSVIQTTVDSGGGISSPSGDPSVDEDLPRDDNGSDGEQLLLPVDGQLTYKGFGEYFEDRFTGYHVAIDLETPANSPVYAIADGIVTYATIVSGYGGMMVIKHEFDGRVVSAIYGHLDPASMLGVGDYVVEGDQMAVLGEKGEETDGEREHLHFAMYEAGEVRLNGYEMSASALSEWLNPYNSVRSDIMARPSSELTYDGREFFPLAFEVPAGWDIEYVPSIQSLNLYTLAGEGTARERSQVLIRYFDASSFLTLSTVTIYSTTDLTVGIGDYTARRYDIEKNPGVPDFVDQPSWRNGRHVVTDFRGADGFTRYYVVAANPALDVKVYESLLASMVVQ